MERFFVRVGGSGATFSASHFLGFAGGSAESVHGHDFRVTVEVEGPLDRDGLVVDFLLLRRVLDSVLTELDHRVLLPGSSTRFRLETEGAELRLSFGDKRWAFPRGDCAVLPIENTTAELLARWMSGRVLDGIRKEARDSGAPAPPISRLRIELEESPGQLGIHEIHP